MTAHACPCGRVDAKQRVVAYAECCGRFVDHLDATPAPDAELLMRSRYSAFVLARADYLLATWHSTTRPASLDFDAGAKWLGLEVRRHALTGPDAAEVERRRALYWQPYHDLLHDELNRLKAQHGHAVLFDGHSIRSVLPWVSARNAGRSSPAGPPTSSYGTRGTRLNSPRNSAWTLTTSGRSAGGRWGMWLTT